MPMIALSMDGVSGTTSLQAAYIKHEVAEYYLKAGLYCKPYNRFPDLSTPDTVGWGIFAVRGFVLWRILHSTPSCDN